MKTYFNFIAILFFCCTITAQSSEVVLNTTKVKELDNFIKDIHNEIGIPGIAIAVIKNNKLVYRNEHGFANIEHEVPVTKKSIFHLYSLTKPFIAVGVFSLIEDRYLSLNDSISKYVKNIPEEWKSVQIKHLLSHSSGLPDMAGKNPYIVKDLTEEESKNRAFKLPMQFQKGEKYDYNQTNFWLLKLIIEKVTKMSLSDWILKNQFPNREDNDVFFSNDAREIITHRVTPYFPWLKGKMIIDHLYTNGDYFYACNGLHLTMNHFIEWDRKLRKNELITQESKQIMWELFDYSNDSKTFSYGWEATQIKGKQGFGFSGALTTFYRIYPSKNISIIFLSNGFSKPYNQDALITELVNLVID